MPALDYSQISYLYDFYVNTDVDIPFYLKETAESSKVLELMSGTGRVSLPLIADGKNLTCVDNSPEMLAILGDKLKKKKLQATVIEMDVCELSLSRKYDLIFIPFHSFSEIINPSDQVKALVRIHGHLQENGRFICTLHNPLIRMKSVDGTWRHIGKYKISDGEKTLVLSILERFDKTSNCVRGLQKYAILDSKNRLLSEKTIDICFYLHEKSTFENMLKTNGFMILDLFGNYDHTSFKKIKSPFMIWILGK